MKLIVRNKEIDSVFQLLGDYENNITESISYALSRCPEFLNLLLKKLLPKSISYSIDDALIYCQNTQYEGITDIEIFQIGFYHIIIEAKCGFSLPSKKQLQKYANDLNKEGLSQKFIWTLSDVMPESANQRSAKSIDGIPIKHITYLEIFDLANKSITSSSNKCKEILRNLNIYLGGIIGMKNIHSNSVYVAPISGNSIKEHNINRTYHCPVGDRYLKEPANYLGFRYDGKLQYINHVEHVEQYNNKGKLMFKFFLGPDIIPSKTVKTGGKYQGTKFYCDIDLLLTCNTIIEASKKTKARYQFNKVNSKT